VANIIFSTLFLHRAKERKMKRWIKVEIEVDKDGNCDCCPVRFVNPEEGYAFCPVDDTLGHTRLDACIAADVTDIVAENEKLEKVLQDYLDDEQKIHKLVSPYIPDILSESGQKTLPMITGELVKEIKMYKRAMEIMNSHRQCPDDNQNDFCKRLWNLKVIPAADLPVIGIIDADRN